MCPLGIARGSPLVILEKVVSEILWDRNQSEVNRVTGNGQCRKSFLVVLTVKKRLAVGCSMSQDSTERGGLLDPCGTVRPMVPMAIEYADLNKGELNGNY